MSDRPIRVGVIGCGAITAMAHLPHLIGRPGVTVAALVDSEHSRAQALARRFGVERVFSDARELPNCADAAVIATPPRTHAALAIDLLRQGLDVYVEKPMALSAADCDAMIRAAESDNRALAVGLVRRFAPWAEFAHNVLSRQLLGPIRSFHFDDGSVYSWPIQSDAFVRREQAGGGVLFDMGPHLFDLALWWIGEIEVTDYADDARGGVEADCAIGLKATGGVTGTIRLSRLRDLGQNCAIECADGTLTVSPFAEQAVTVGGLRLSGRVSGDSGAGNFLTWTASALDDWLACIRHRRPPRHPAQSARRATELIEQCYRLRRPIEEPWAVPAVSA